MDPIIWHSDEIFGLVDQEPLYLTLPKLECLSFENDPLNLLVWYLSDINNDHIKSIDIYLLEAHHQLFVLVVKISHNRDARISYV